MKSPQTLNLQLIQKAINDHSVNITCQQLHGEKCLLRALKYGSYGIKKFTKTYLLYFLAIFVLMKIKNILKDPINQIKKFLKALSKSLLFAGFCLGTTAYACCFSRKLTNNNGQFVLSIAGAIGGAVGLMFESPQRQRQIALFKFTYGLQVLYLMGQRRKALLNIPQFFSLLYGLSMSIVCYHYFNNKQSIKKSYSKLIQKILKDC